MRQTGTSFTIQGYTNTIKKPIEHHSYNRIEENIEMLHKLNKGKLLELCEEYEIHKQRNNDNILNEKIISKSSQIYMT